MKTCKDDWIGGAFDPLLTSHVSRHTLYRSFVCGSADGFKNGLNQGVNCFSLSIRESKNPCKRNLER